MRAELGGGRSPIVASAPTHVCGSGWQSSSRAAGGAVAAAVVAAAAAGWGWGRGAGGRLGARTYRQTDSKKTILGYMAGYMRG